MTRLLWVIGDSWTDPDRGGWVWRDGWPALVAARLGLGLVNSGEGGQGYAAGTAAPFPVQIERGTGHGADLVVVWGSVNDRNEPPEDVYAAAAHAYRMLARTCPGAPVLVFGPQWWHTEPEPSLYPTIEAVRAAAGAAGLPFVDPHRWLRDRPDLMDDSGNHPSPDGHALLADLILPALLGALQVPTERGDLDEPAGWLAPWLVDDLAVTLPPA